MCTPIFIMFEQLSTIVPKTVDRFLSAAFYCAKLWHHTIAHTAHNLHIIHTNTARHTPHHNAHRTPHTTLSTKLPKYRRKQTDIMASCNDAANNRKTQVPKWACARARSDPTTKVSHSRGNRSEPIIYTYVQNIVLYMYVCIYKYGYTYVCMYIVVCLQFYVFEFF